MTKPARKRSGGTMKRFANGLIRLYSPSTGHELIDDHDGRNDQQQMDQATRDVEGQEAECPKNHENDGDSPQHGGFLLWLVLPRHINSPPASAFRGSRRR